MLAPVNTPQGQAPAEIRDVAEPEAAPNEAIVEVKAFGLNRGELMLLATRPEGWQPGQDIAGIVVKAAADGSGPRVGARVVGLADQAWWLGPACRGPNHQARLAPIPDNVSFTSAATLPVAG
ncbi:MAG TPA: hypothetical protein VHZ51_19875 [Ktedonobacteraceae bacterium]|nr:hypothetical protein [Ktedonobacteraceae bacterium]